MFLKLSLSINDVAQNDAQVMHGCIGLAKWNFYNCRQSNFQCKSNFQSKEKNEMKKTILQIGMVLTLRRGDKL